MTTSIVLTAGVFDLLHPGHIEHFYESKIKAVRTTTTSTYSYHNSFNPIPDTVKLLVLLNSDSSIAQLNRKFPPVFNQYERYTMLKNIGLIDDVILFDEPTPCTALVHVVRAIRATDSFEGRSSRDIFYTKGGDYAEQTIPEQRICKEEEISLFFTTPKSNNSSDIYNRIKGHIT